MTRAQLVDVEGLDDIIVCARLKASYLIARLNAGCQKQNRTGDVAADLLADRKTVRARHVDVEQNGVGALPGLPYGFCAVIRSVDEKAVELKVASQHIHHAPLVVDN